LLLVIRTIYFYKNKLSLSILEFSQTVLLKSDLKKTFDAYYEALVSYGCRFITVRDECEDLVQDIFVDLWEKDLKFPDEISLKVYLYKTTRNKCFNFIKHQSQG
jgi:DNA-directed RNA polymerase specialized sigma24 family protein